MRFGVGELFLLLRDELGRSSTDELCVPELRSGFFDRGLKLLCLFLEARSFFFHHLCRERDQNFYSIGDSRGPEGAFGFGAFYAQRTLLKREVLPENVAAAVFALTGGDLTHTTGLHVPVDAGVAAAFLR